MIFRQPAELQKGTELRERKKKKKKKGTNPNRNNTDQTSSPMVIIHHLSKNPEFISKVKYRPLTLTLFLVKSNTPELDALIQKAQDDSPLDASSS